MGFQRWQLPRIEPVELEARFSVNAPALKRQTRAAPDRDGLSFPCGGDNFGGRKFDRAGATELAEQRVYVAARKHAAQQPASVGCHEAANLRHLPNPIPKTGTTYVRAHENKSR